MQSSTELTVLVLERRPAARPYRRPDAGADPRLRPGYAVGNRDGSRFRVRYSARLTRGLTKFLETYAAFVGLALALAVPGEAGGLGATGAVIWFWARLVYVPVFAAGIPVRGLRSGRSR